MNYARLLGLFAVVVGALMAFAGTASATTPTSPKGTAYTGTYKAEAEGTTELHGEAFSVSCGKSVVEGNISQHGAGLTTKGSITTLNFTECSYSVTFLKLGTLEAHATVKGSDADGTVTSTGAEFTIHGPFGINCLFQTNNTDVGTGSLTSTATTGGNATLDIGSSLIPRTGDSAFCGGFGEWTGSYRVVNPSTLYIDE
ncbi:MAG TPA: hypothetical protein VFY75_05425 [Solirubrobacterales bacterium]|nr:hypothetical protein [Solirubrobacterales bacterium]